jgi:hypothetical protein
MISSLDSFLGHSATREPTPSRRSFIRIRVSEKGEEKALRRRTRRQKVESGEALN